MMRRSMEEAMEAIGVPKARVVYDETTRVASRGTMCTAEEGRTRQEAADGCDINKIIAQFGRGVLPSFLDQRVAQYVDTTEMLDLHGSLERVRRADAVFAALPVTVRNAFENDVGEFVAAFDSEAGVARLRALGMLPETDETLADRREAATEVRAEKRAAARAEAARVAAAKQPLSPRNMRGSPDKDE